MHEVALAQELVSLIEQVARANDAARVTRAVVEIGELASVVPEALAFAFEIARADTVASGCALQLAHVPLCVRCAACGYQGEARRGLVGCPRCDAVPLEVIAGRDMRLVSIDVEDG